MRNIVTITTSEGDVIEREVDGELVVHDWYGRAWTEESFERVPEFDE